MTHSRRYIFQDRWARLLLFFGAVVFVSVSVFSGASYLEQFGQSQRITEMRNQAQPWRLPRSYSLLLTRRVSGARLRSEEVDVFRGFFLLDRSSVGEGHDRTADLENARSVFENHLDDLPQDALAWTGLGLALAGLGQGELAQTALQNAQAFAPLANQLRWPRAMLAAQLWPSLNQEQRRAALGDMSFLWQHESIRQLGGVILLLPSDADQEIVNTLSAKGLDTTAFERFLSRIRASQSTM